MVVSFKITIFISPRDSFFTETNAIHLQKLPAIYVESNIVCQVASSSWKLEAHITQGNSTSKRKTTFLHLHKTHNIYIMLNKTARFKAGNSCYYSVQTILSSRLLPKNWKIKIYKTIILPVVLHGYIKGGMEAKGMWKQDPEANIWAHEGSNGEWRRFHNEELHSLYR